jgi:hypothetical protein
MSANTTPIFTLTPRQDVGQVTTANVNRDGTGTPVVIATAGANGTRIDLIRVQAVGATTVGVVRLFIYNGVNIRLYKEILIPAVTPSTSIEAYSFNFRPEEPLVLPSGYSLQATTNNTETFNIHVHGGDY